MPLQFNPFTGTFDVTTKGDTGAVAAAGDGTAAAPGITFASDTDSGIYRTGPNALAVSTGGTGRLFITSAGLIGINQSSPGSALDVAGEVRIYPTSGTANLRFGTAGAEKGKVAIDSSSNYIIETAGSERLRITSAGLVGIGTSTPQASLDITNGTFQAVRTNLSSITDTFHQYRGTPDGLGYEHARVFSGRDTSVHTYGSYLAFYTEGKASGTTDTSLERLRIDSLGRVGIGTTPDSILHVLGPGGIAGLRVGYNNTSVNYYDADTQIFRAANATERARIDSSGRFLVGTSNSTDNTRLNSKISVVGIGAGQYPGISINGYTGTDPGPAPFIDLNRSRGTTDGSYTEVVNNDVLGYIVFRGSDGVAWSQAATIQAEADGDWTTSGDTTDSPGRLVFSTTSDGQASSTPRMTIQSDGDVLIGRTSELGSVHRLVIERDNLAVGINTFNGGNNEAVRFYNAGTAVGTISTTGSATAYNTSSDYRLKENVTPVTDGIIRLQQLKPSRFNFIADPAKTVDGFIAHEVQTIVPEAITGEKDAVDDDGNPVYQGIDQSKLVPLLTAALQEAIGEIESLKARVAALEAS